MIRVHRFRSGDLGPILKIEKASFGIDAWPADLLRQYANACPQLFLIARVGGAVAGYSITCVANNAAEIVSIAVLPRFRGRGIAKRLLERSILQARRSQATTVRLMVRRHNAAAIELYRGLGFVRTATVSGYYEDGAAGWRMRLSLSTG